MELLCVVVLLTFKLFIGANADALKNQTSLRMVNVVFRHGDRTPESTETFPNDPNRNFSYFPFGPGELTNGGKARAFQFGKMLRKRYDRFLGSIYLPKEVYARSTSIPRTKMTLLSALAALYPPPPSQKWYPSLKWQPIPYTYLPTQQDGLMFALLCPPFVSEYEKVFESNEMKEQLEKYRNLTVTLQKLTGRNITSLVDFASIRHTLISEKFYGLRLPEWTKEVWKELEDAVAFQTLTLSYNTVLKRRHGGILLNKMIENMKAVINNSSDGGQRKIALYSGHDTNVAALATTLGVMEWCHPMYTSANIIELHKKDDDYFVKVLYYHGIPSKVEEMTIPGCNILCPWEKFLQLTKDVIPSDDELQCDTPEGGEIRPLVSGDKICEISQLSF